MLRAISFGVFCRLAPSTSAIMRSRNVSRARAVMRTTISIGEHPGAAGDRRTVAAGLPDHRRRFAGDRRLVDRWRCPRRSRRRRGSSPRPTRRRCRRRAAATTAPPRSPRRRRDGWPSSPPGLAQRRRLRLAAALGHGLGEVGEQHGEPQPRGDQSGEEVLLRGRVAEVAEEQDRGEHAADERRRTSPGCGPVRGDRACGSCRSTAWRTIAGSNSGCSRGPLGPSVAGRSRGLGSASPCS